MAIDLVLPFVWPYGLAFWAVVVWSYWLEGRQHRQSAARMASHDGADRYSGVVIAVGSSIMQVLAFVAAFHAPWSVGPEWVALAFWAGLAMVVAGMLLRMHCWRVLGKFFTPTVTIATDHKVVEDGAYRWVRHPAYTGAILTLLGLGVALGNWGSLAIMATGTAIIYIYRIRAEENALEAALGDAYVRFKAKRRLLVPYLF